MKKDVKNLLLSLLLLVLIIVLIIFLPNIISNSKNNKEQGKNDKTNQEQNIEKEISLDSELIKNLIYPYEIFFNETKKKTEYYQLDSYNLDNFTMEEKIAIAFDYQSFIIENPYQDGSLNDPSKIAEDFNSYTIDPINNETMKSYFVQFYGPDTPYEPTSFNSLFGTHAIYNNGIYQIQIPYGVGGGIGGNLTIVHNIPYRAVIKDDILTIYEYAYFTYYDHINDKTIYYKDNKLTEIITEATTKEEIEKNKENLNKYKYTFKKHSDGKFYFEKGEWL